jgi:hypothetical protein
MIDRKIHVGSKETACNSSIRAILGELSEVWPDSRVLQSSQLYKLRSQLKPHVAAPIGSHSHTFDTSTYTTLGRIISPYTSSVSVDTDLRYPPEA